VHARCGFIINTLRKKTSTGAVRKDDNYCAVCGSAATTVAIGQLQLQLSHYSLVALQAFCFPKCDLGLDGASKNFLGSLLLAVFSGPLINYAIIRVRPLQPTSIEYWTLYIQEYHRPWRDPSYRRLNPCVPWIQTITTKEIIAYHCQVIREL